MKKTNNSGISMITLVVTIAVLLILAVIAFGNSTRSIDEAAKTKMMVELENYKEELRTFKMNKILEDSGFADDSLYATKDALIYNTNKQTSTAGNIRDVIPNISDSYFNELRIIRENLAVASENVTLLAAAEEAGLSKNPYTVSDGVLVSVAGNNDLIDETGALTIPPMITALGAGSFSNVAGLKTIVIPGTCTEIKTNAFANNKELEKVIIEDWVKTIGNYAFMNCSNLKEIEIADSVTSLGAQMCYGDTSLGKIKLSA